MATHKRHRMAPNYVKRLGEWLQTTAIEIQAYRNLRTRKSCKAMGWQTCGILQMNVQMKKQKARMCQQRHSKTLEEKEEEADKQGEDAEEAPATIMPRAAATATPAAAVAALAEWQQQQCLLLLVWSLGCLGTKP